MKAEVEVLHPLVAQWLRKNGYDFKHEVVLPLGRADFVAQHRTTDEVLVVEVKDGFAGGIQSAVNQVLRYCAQVPGAKPALAAPLESFSTGDHKLLKQLGIVRIELQSRALKRQYAQQEKETRAKRKVRSQGRIITVQKPAESRPNRIDVEALAQQTQAAFNEVSRGFEQVQIGCDQFVRCFVVIMPIIFEMDRRLKAIEEILSLPSPDIRPPVAALADYLMAEKEARKNRSDGSSTAG